MGDNRKNIILTISIILFIGVITVGSLIFFKVQTGKMTKMLSDSEFEKFEKYYVMIVNDRNSEFWKSVYEGAREQGLEKGVYVELLGNNLSAEYSKSELMEIAIWSKADGIIIQADESNRMTELIDEAVQEGIPVVTVLDDNATSSRQSFVGIASYNLGREYGRQVIELCGNESKNVLVLMRGSTDGTGQHVLFSGIQETIDNEMPDDGKAIIDIKAVDNESTFSTEESIRDIFMNSEQLPDIIICMDEQIATCAYQAVVDYNKVGDINVIGYYHSQNILRAIERNVVYSTMSINTVQMGEFCVEALNEYNEMGNVSGYFSVDITVINPKNVKDYMGGGSEDE